jgi:hypothetical protein
MLGGIFYYYSIIVIFKLFSEKTDKLAGGQTQETVNSDEKNATLRFFEYSLAVRLIQKLSLPILMALLSVAVVLESRSGLDVVRMIKS